MKERKASANSTYPKGGVYFRAASRSCSKDSFVVNQTLVFQIKFCGENRHLRQAICELSIKKWGLFISQAILLMI